MIPDVCVFVGIDALYMEGELGWVISMKYNYRY